jgi:nucleoside-diphosphate-sugar epimerase
MEYLKKRYPDAQRTDAPWRAGDVMHTQAEILKIQRVLGYTVQTRVWEGVEKTCDWYDQNWENIAQMKLRT